MDNIQFPAFHCYKYTTDNFCENYDNDLVKISYIGNIQPPTKTPPIYRIGVWGTDDFGLIYDTTYETLMIQKIFSVLQQDVIDIDWLVKNEFEYF